MRIAILWTGLSGYLNACLRELASRPDVQLFVSNQAVTCDAPFAEYQFDWMGDRMVWKDSSDLHELPAKLSEFSPQILVFSGWHVKAYRQAARALRGKAWRVMTMDNCWLGTLKQRLAVAVAPWFPRPLADAVWLSGERQATFARKLRFQQREILMGMYSCDSDTFHQVHEARMAQGGKLKEKFLFLGRLIPEKGIEVLAKAYAIYRSRVSAPWPLACCGAGPLRSVLDGLPGIELNGFVQPQDLPSMMASAGCLILPSQFEPWAVVIHEAAAAGLPVLASNRVGAAIHLVQPGFNGYLFDSWDSEGLATLMQWMTGMSEQRRQEMSQGSFYLSLQYSPRRWADTLLDGYAMAHGEISNQ